MKKQFIFLLMCSGFMFTGMTMADDALIEQGKGIFQYWCTPCHGDGPEYPGTVALAAKYKNQIPALLDQRTDMNGEFVKTFVRNGISIMPFFRKTEISDADLEAIVAYLGRNNE